MWDEIKDYIAAAEAAGEVVEITSRTELLTPTQAASRLGGFARHHRPVPRVW